MRDVTFSPPNRGALWSMLALTKTQLAQLCNLTTRQVSHWTNQGYIMTSGRNPERYNGDAIDLCILIKQGLNNGIPLKRSVRLAREYIANELAHQPMMRTIQPPALLDMREKLRSAELSLGTVLEVVEALVPRDDQIEPLADEAAAAAEE